VKPTNTGKVSELEIHSVIQIPIVYVQVCWTRNFFYACENSL